MTGCRFPAFLVHLRRGVPRYDRSYETQYDNSFRRNPPANGVLGTFSQHGGTPASFPTCFRDQTQQSTGHLRVFILHLPPPPSLCLRALSLSLSLRPVTVSFSFSHFAPSVSAKSSAQVSSSLVSRLVSVDSSLPSFRLRFVPTELPRHAEYWHLLPRG